MTTTQKIAYRLYDTDFVAWTKQTVQQIRTKQFEQVDWEAVIEEIESLGKSDRRELKSRLEVLLQHLLKWQYQPNLRSASWRNTIDEQRNRIADLLEESPSLKSYPEEVLAECYRRGRKAASNETELPLDIFPVESPYTCPQLFDPEFLPGIVDFYG
ncbi:DUF29 domain-containing protein [Limnofasciculus baicalensis]|uniref:DUF29 domain-containing protein n=1 Tax=Limnofasciculus baicalensis BBK-W-15 TaxID=2699891 RepID=A0AAE3GN15_9CYAN|nr:DUF29 domain-containing protein [Limnofasciculus baicalensis]MCP2727616.1 DUF29 domain-containing protein [Limnofasciculus baicalensis BBK-W-15]